MIHLYQDTPIGGGDALYAMTDVNINNPENGQMLVYDASTQRWRNVTQKSLNDLAEVTDLTDIIATGTTNATGGTITKGKFFYLNDDLCQAKADIASGATFTLNTNYEEVTAGGLNALNSKIGAMGEYVEVTKSTASETRGQMLMRLYGLIDQTKITPRACIVSGSSFVFNLTSIQPPYLSFCMTYGVSASDATFIQLSVSNNNATWRMTSIKATTVTSDDYSSFASDPVGMSIRFYY